jgi:hypothetical protein
VVGPGDRYVRLSAERPIMQPQATTTESVSFSTGGLSRRERNDALRNLQQRGIMTVEPLADHVPRAAIRKRFLPGADIRSGN